MNETTDPAIINGIGLGVIPTQKRSVEVRDRLFRAAMDEFSERGIEGSRVENIVADADTSWGTFFRYFPRKEDVLLLAAVRHYQQYVRPVYETRQEKPDTTIRDTIRDVFSQLLMPRIDNRLHAEMISETIRNTPRFAAILGEGEMPVILLLSNLIEEGQNRDEIRTDVSPFEAAVVIGAGVMFSTTPVLRAVAAGEMRGPEIVAVADRAFNLIWDGLRVPI